MSARAVAAGFALALSAGWSISNVGAVAERLAHAYGVGLGAIGLFTTALFVSHAAMQVPAGRLCDRFGARLVGAAGLSVIAIASAGALARREVALVLALRVVTGIGTALTFVGGSDYVRAALGTPVAQGLYGGVSLGAGGLALAVVPQLAGWRAPFWTAALLAGVGALVVLLAPREGARPVAARALPSFRDRRLLRLAALHSASFGLSVVIGNWVVTLLERAGGYGSGAAGVAGALTLAGGIVSRPLGGRLLDRPVLLRASLVAGAAATLILALARPLALAIAAAALVGFAAGIPFAAAFAGAARARPEAPAAAVGLVNMAAALTILVATPLVGLSFSLPGAGRIGFVAIALLWLSGVFAVRTRRA